MFELMMMRFSDNLGSYAHNVQYIMMSQVNMSSYFTQLLDWFPNLEGMSLPKCNIRSMDGIDKCRRLRIIDLHDNHLTTISPDILYLKNTLIGLALGGCDIFELPDFFTELTNLRYLYLDNLPLENLPEDIGKLSELTLLRCRDCCFRSLPDSIKNLNVHHTNIC